MTILVVGGAGYVGSHMVKALRKSGQSVLVADDFSTGHRSALLGANYVDLSSADAPALDHLFANTPIEAVMHFASFIQVAESMKDPGKYYANTVTATLTLLQAMVRAGIGRFIFSSTAAIYGTPQRVPLDEGHPKAAINPYGRAKWMVEQMLEDFDRAHGLKSVCLRYFNAAGADPEGELGERHDPETHLIPLILQTAAGRRGPLTIYGQDYDTPDGTCIRDYVHVCDLTAAHALALDYLCAGGESTAFNLGNGTGFSVRQVIEAAEKVVGHPLAVEYGPRRAGDPPRLVADATRARDCLGWQPRFSALETILAHAWAWEQKYPWGA